MGTNLDLPLALAETIFILFHPARLITHLIPHFEQRRHLDWAQTSHKRAEFATFLDQTASSLDNLLAGFAVCGSWLISRYLS